MLATLTAAGLSTAAGFNAYIPYLVVALLARLTDTINLPAQFQWMESGWSIGIASVLLVSEIVLDKIPAVDSVNDAVATVIRPATGGLIAAASTAASEFESSNQFFTNNPWVGAMLGAAVALLVHGGKTAARPVINTATLGSGAVVVSSVEDGASTALSFAAIFAPILAAVMLVALLIFGVWLFIKVRRWRERRRERGLAPGSNEEPAYQVEVLE